MARTRSTRSPGAQIKEENTNGNDATPTPTFNDTLTRFKYKHDSPSRGVSTPVYSAVQKSRNGSPRIIKARTRPSPSPSKRRKGSSKYAPPSRYAHLSELTDVIESNLICVFVGTNPGIRTATAGHAYAHPSNLFWKLLHSSGCTDRRCAPEEDVNLPRLYAMGNTNIVSRPSKDAAELSRTEMAAGTPILEEKFRKYRPEAVCIVGKGIWEAIWRWRYGKNPSKEEFQYGWQDDKERMGKVQGEWPGARVFVATSTSGLSASTRPHEKEEIWRPFGEWVQQRRRERAEHGIESLEDSQIAKEKIDSVG